MHESSLINQWEKRSKYMLTTIFSLLLYKKYLLTAKYLIGNRRYPSPYINMNFCGLVIEGIMTLHNSANELLAGAFSDYDRG